MDFEPTDDAMNSALELVYLQQVGVFGKPRMDETDQYPADVNNVRALAHTITQLCAYTPDGSGNGDNGDCPAHNRVYSRDNMPSLMLKTYGGTNTYDGHIIAEDVIGALDLSREVTRARPAGKWLSGTYIAHESVFITSLSDPEGGPALTIPSATMYRRLEAPRKKFGERVIFEAFKPASDPDILEALDIINAEALAHLDRNNPDWLHALTS